MKYLRRTVIILIAVGLWSVLFDWVKSLRVSATGHAETAAVVDTNKLNTNL